MLFVDNLDSANCLHHILELDCLLHRNIAWILTLGRAHTCDYS